MFITFFNELKSAGIPVTLREYLGLMEAMQADLASRRVEDFYYLSRALLVKDERNLDKFDRVFGHVFRCVSVGVLVKNLELVIALVANHHTEWPIRLSWIECVDFAHIGFMIDSANCSCAGCN